MAEIVIRGVILMDEPLSNPDALLRMQMRAELRGVLADPKTTTICVTRGQIDAMSMADRIAVTNGGGIVQAANPVQVCRNRAVLGSAITLSPAMRCVWLPWPTASAGSTPKPKPPCRFRHVRPCPEGH